jgi:hypothetical protein
MHSGAFDAIWYKHKYGIRGINPLFHFAFIGIHQGKYPNSRFDRSSYMVMNPDIAINKIDPLIDYLFRGWWEKKIHVPGGPSSVNAFQSCHSRAKKNSE